MPNKLRNSMKGLINIRNNDNKCFIWYHIKYLNPLKTHSERMTETDQNIINDLNYKSTRFSLSEKGYSKNEQKNNICIDIFCYKNNSVYLVYVSNKNLETVWIY